MTVVTRFAPSPTGYLHIGGARTALFNWLFARRMGGKFLLRIEDTDKERNTPEAIAAIHSGMAWLGLDHDGPVVLQSQWADRHVQIARRLLEDDKAYYSDGAVRIRGIKGGQTIEDLVQGTVHWPQDIDDFVILRSDGSPTYMLSVVVDDYDMGITHVIRGDDHLNNAFRQMSIYKALGWDIPQYAHIPLIHDEDGKKLSKRRGAAAVEQYRDEFGILPEAMLNYLARLGWGHGNDELFTMAQATEWFDLKDVGKAPARLDKKKLASINGHYIREKTPLELATIVMPKIRELGVQPLMATVLDAMRALRERSSDINALVDGTKFLWEKSPIVIEDKAREKINTKILRDLNAILDITVWETDGLETNIKHYAEANNLKLGEVAGSLRAALTGRTISPPIFDVLMLLGKEESLKRIREAR